MLKKLRVTASILVMAVITLGFIDIAGFITNPLLQKLQFFPALLALNVTTLFVVVAATLLFGRIYCSIICPLGILQDFFNWLSKKFYGKKKKYGYKPVRWWLRITVLVIVLGACICGFSVIVSMIEPYSAFGRIATQLFKPLYMLGNNLLAAVSEMLGSYMFIHTGVTIRQVASFIVALSTLIIIGIVSFVGGRTYCNTICPVGTVLGFLSKYSVFKIRIDTDKCNHCMSCQRKCKAYCIDSKNQQIDYSRCVDCFDCIGSCHQGAIYFGPRKKAVQEKPVDESRRDFLKSGVVAAAIIPQALSAKNKWDFGVQTVKKEPVSPPGSVSHQNLNQHCTACHLCISKCPSKVLKPAGMEYGLAGFMQPVMKFDQGYCNYDCTICSEVCPAGAIKPITVQEKHTLQPGHVVFLPDACVVHQQHSSCGACAEHCPTQAVSMVPWEGGLTHPEINTDLCVGCGGCQFICPVHAIYVDGNPVHLTATLPSESEKSQVEDFGFGF